MAVEPAWNIEKLVQISVAGEVAAPILPGRLGASSFFVGHDGTSHFGPPWAGVVRNVRVGDPARGWAGERVEPGVSIRHRDHSSNLALTFLSCIGNEAIVMSGKAQGATGVVTGKHGRFAETVITQFAPEVLPDLVTGDRIVVVAHGTGLAIGQAPGVAFKSIAPPVARRLVAALRDGAVEVPVVGIVPPELAGAGLGLSSDADSLAIQTADGGYLEEQGLAGLRLGDVVAFRDIECRWTNCYRRGACSVAVVSACDSVQAGFGVVTTIVMTAREDGIRPVIDAGANLLRCLT